MVFKRHKLTSNRPNYCEKNTVFVNIVNALGLVSQTIQLEILTGGWEGLSTAITKRGKIQETIMLQIAAVSLYLLTLKLGGSFFSFFKDEYQGIR